MPTPNDFSDYQFNSPDKSTERQNSQLGTAGEYGQAGPQSPLNGDVPAGEYPNLLGGGESREFSSDKASTPQQMAEEANGSAFYDTQHFFMTNPYLPGSRICHSLDEGPLKPAHDAAPGTGDGKTGPA